MDKPPIEIENLIRQHVEAFNAADISALNEVFSDTAIIVDGIAPYRWLNPHAPEKWMADADKWRAGLGVTSERFTYELSFWTVEGDFAYAAVTGSLTVSLKDQNIVRNGILAYTFAKIAGTWKIEAQTWARLT